MAADLLRGRIVHIHAAHLHLQLPIRAPPDIHVRLSENGEQVARAGLLQQFPAHQQVRVHAHHLRGTPHVRLEMRDDVFVYIAKAFAQQPQFFAAVAKGASALPHPVVDVTPSLGADWNGEPSVFFLIVLADGTPHGQLLNFTRQISQDIVRQVQPLEEWGVLPYFNYRTQWEHARAKDPMWA